MVRDLVSANVSMHHVLEFFSSFRSSTPIHNKRNESKLSNSLGMQHAHISKSTRHNRGLRTYIDEVKQWILSTGVEIVWSVKHPVEFGFLASGLAHELLRRTKVQSSKSLDVGFRQCSQQCTV